MGSPKRKEKTSVDFFKTFDLKKSVQIDSDGKINSEQKFEGKLKVSDL